MCKVHWTQIDTDRNIHFLFVRDLEKIIPKLDEGVESCSNGVHWIHWTQTDSDRNGHFLFVADLDKFHSCYMFSVPVST